MSEIALLNPRQGYFFACFYYGKKMRLILRFILINNKRY